MRKHICSIIFVITLIVVCGAIPFRQRRQIDEQSILNNGISQQDVDQSSDFDERLDDSQSLPIVADLSEVTQASASNDRDAIDDAVEINDGEDEVLNDRGLPDTGDDVNLHEQNIDSGNGDYFEHEGADNDPILNEIFRESPGNHSNQGSGEIQDGTESVVHQIETTSSQYSEQHIHNRRNLDEETDNQHFLLGEIDTDSNQILNMTDTNYERTFTLGVGRDDLDIGGEQKSEHQRHNDTNVFDHDREYMHNATDENSLISNTDGTESGVTREHMDSGPGEGSRNSTSGQQEGNFGGLNSIDHSQDHETELNGPNNENANSVDPDSGVDFPIDKGTHPHEEQGGIEHFNPPRHTYNPLTANISPSIEPTVETRTNPNIATPLPVETDGLRSGEPLILTMTTSTERNAPDEHLHHMSGGNEENEHIGETGESQIHGINGENSGEGPETGDHSEQSGHEATENPNAGTKNEEKQPGKDDAKSTHSVHLQTYSNLPISRNLSPTPTTELRVSTAPLSTSYSAVLEITSSRGDSFLIDTEIIDMESASLYDVQTIEYFSSDNYPDIFPELKSSESTYTSSTVQPLRILSTPTSSLISTVSPSEPTSLQSFESSSISSPDRPVFSSMSHQYPDIVPTLSSVYHSELTQTPGSSIVSISSRHENTHTSKQFPYVSNPSESSITMVSTSVASQTPLYTSSDTSQLVTTSSSSLSTTTSQLSVVTSAETNAPSSQWLHSTPVSTGTSGTHTSQTLPSARTTNQTLPSARTIIQTLPSARTTNQTLPSARTTNKKEENTTYITTIPITTRKKSDSDKDKPENASSSTLVATIPTTGISTPLSTRNLVQVALTSQKVVLSTPPSVYIQIELRMGWYEFCSSKILFISQISNIILSEKEITVPIEQFKITTEYCSDANPTILNTGSITIQMYIVDNDGKIDVRLTLVTSDLIVKGFEDSNYFKDKIVSVHYHPNRLVERIQNEKTLRKPSSPDVTMVIVIASVGGVCCFALIILQILIHRRVKSKKKQRPLMGHRTSIQSLDHVALGVIPKSRPGSGYWNPALDGTIEELEPKELSHVLNFSLLANFCMDPRGLHTEFQTIPFDSPESPGVVFGEEDKNRFANVLPYKHSRVKLKSIEEKKSDYINANYIRGYKGAKHVYIATQSPLVNTVDDFWRMVWEQQTRAILILNPVTQHAKPKQSTCYWPDNLETDMRREYGDFTVTLTKRDVQQDYIDCTLELMDIERNLKREVHHFWYTCWSDSGPPEPLSFVKFVLDTRPHYENSGAPVVVHCGPGTGRSGTFIAVDTCMRMFEDKRRVDILRCVHKMRNERAGAVQSREQYSLIYQSLNEYGVILSSPSISTRSSVVTLHAML